MACKRSQMQVLQALQGFEELSSPQDPSQRKPGTSQSSHFMEGCKMTLEVLPKHSHFLFKLIQVGFYPSQFTNPS